MPALTGVTDAGAAWIAYLNEAALGRSPPTDRACVGILLQTPLLPSSTFPAVTADLTTMPAVPCDNSTEAEYDAGTETDDALEAEEDVNIQAQPQFGYLYPGEEVASRPGPPKGWRRRRLVDLTPDPDIPHQLSRVEDAERAGLQATHALHLGRVRFGLTTSPSDRLRLYLRVTKAYRWLRADGTLAMEDELIGGSDFEGWDPNAENGYIPPDSSGTDRPVQGFNAKEVLLKNPFTGRDYLETGISKRATSADANGAVRGIIFVLFEFVILHCRLQGGKWVKVNWQYYWLYGEVQLKKGPKGWTITIGPVVSRQGTGDPPSDIAKNLHLGDPKIGGSLLRKRMAHKLSCG